MAGFFCLFVNCRCLKACVCACVRACARARVQLSPLYRIAKEFGEDQSETCRLWGVRLVVMVVVFSLSPLMTAFQGFEFCCHFSILRSLVFFFALVALPLLPDCLQSAIYHRTSLIFYISFI